MLRRGSLAMEFLIIFLAVLIGSFIAFYIYSQSVNTLSERSSEISTTAVPEPKLSAVIIYDKNHGFGLLQKVLTTAKVDVKAIPVDQITFSDLVQYDIVICVADVGNVPQALNTMQRLLEMGKEAILFYECGKGLSQYAGAGSGHYGTGTDTIPASKKVTIDVSDYCVGFCDGLIDTYMVAATPISYIKTECSHPSLIRFRYEDPQNPGTYKESDLLCVSQKRAYISIDVEAALKEGWPGLDRLIINVVTQLTGK